MPFLKSMDFFEGIYYFFQSETFQNIIAILKPTCFISIFISLFVIVWTLIKSPWVYWHISADLSDFLHAGPVSSETIYQRKWEKIKKRLSSHNEANWKLAIIEAEEIVEEVLSKMGYKGDGIREKLKGVDPATIPQLPNLISGYDIFINIIADKNYQIKQEDAIKIVSNFEEFLKSVEMI